ncbi:uncharacterized protein LOC124355302 isoform X3 [Homalodisca vitripennis]|uniref:uncharacterized protein LOC124355302 isoform X3 n=1 Tax=Homalodisca vitripennis TaxID=197043 RepID=UPI001EE9F2D1|nr:uncharacterized protein LOC124355302 isoform X3 [Homalodisca vitripennis]
MDAMEVDSLGKEQSYDNFDCNVQICRVCLLSDLDMRDLFSENETKPLSDKVMSFTNVKMYSGDGLPQKVCFGCVAKLETAYEFKLQVEQADKVLRSKSETLDIKEKFFSEEGVSAEADSDNGVDESYMDDSFVDMDDDAEKTIENENCTTLKVFKPTHTNFEEVNCLSVEDDKNTQCGLK